MNIDNYDYFYDYDLDFDEISYKAAIEYQPIRTTFIRSFREVEYNKSDEVIINLDTYKLHHEDDFIRDHYQI